MRLTTIHIHNFKCIEDSGCVKVNDVTCLVGKNESGKTAILQALHRVNPHTTAVKYNKIHDYPRRHLADYDARHKNGVARVVDATWELNDADKAALSGLLGDAAASIVTVDSTHGYGFNGTWTVDFDEAKLVKSLMNESGLHKEEKKKLDTFKTLSELAAGIKALGDAAGERHKALLLAIKKRFGDAGDCRKSINALFAARVPKIVYFSNYDTMSGRVPLEFLQAKIRENRELEASERLFLDFCEFAGSSLNELAKITKFEDLKARFEAASSKISDQVFEYWTQNPHLSVEFSRDEGLAEDPAPFNNGHVFNVRIKNELHGVTVPFNERSAGFVWFFSFLVLFSQVRKSLGDNLIILLDEPGLNLHAKAQEDLLRFIDEKLRPHYQVVYSTHSPFLVPVDKLESVRTVEDVIEERPRGKPIVHGTKLREDVLEVTGDTLFPLFGALGFEITHNLFFGKNTLVVEGPSDLLYLRAVSRQLTEAGRIGLDARWVICPVGGVDKVPAFVALFGANTLNLVVLIDYTPGQKGKVRQLESLTEKLYEKNRVFTTASMLGVPEADLEDVLGKQFYLDLINDLTAGKPGLVMPKEEPSRIVPYVENEMRGAGADFDHYSPAEHLLLARKTLFSKLSENKACLDRFEAFFKSINALIV